MSLFQKITDLVTALASIPTAVADATASLTTFSTFLDTV